MRHIYVYRCSDAKSCPALWDPMDCSTFVQTHVHSVSDTTQPSHPLSSPSLLALNLSQHQGLFQWVGSSYQVAKALELQLQHPMNIQGWFPLGLTSLISLEYQGLSRVFSSTTIQKHQFLGAKPSLWFNSVCIWPYMTVYDCIWLYMSVYDYWKNHSSDYRDLVDKVMSLLFHTLSRFVIYIKKDDCAICDSLDVLGCTLKPLR